MDRGRGAGAGGEPRALIAPAFADRLLSSAPPPVWYSVGPVATILVVQADPALRRAWTAALRDGGHAVLEVGDVTEGVRHAREGGIDAVILDSVDPSRSARALVDELERLPEPPPLVLVSSSPRAPEQSAHLGAAAFVPKPCSPDDVLHAVTRVVSGRPRSILGDLALDDDENTEKRRLDQL